MIPTKACLILKQTVWTMTWLEEEIVSSQEILNMKGRLLQSCQDSWVLISRNILSPFIYKVVIWPNMPNDNFNVSKISGPKSMIFLCFGFYHPLTSQEQEEPLRKFSWHSKIASLFKLPRYHNVTVTIPTILRTTNTTVIGQYNKELKSSTVNGSGDKKMEG